MAEILPVRRKTLSNQSINQSIDQSTEAFWANFNQRLKTENGFQVCSKEGPCR